MVLNVDDEILNEASMGYELHILRYLIDYLKSLLHEIKNL